MSCVGSYLVYSNSPRKSMIIGLSGKMGSGKDTVADIICKLWPHVPFERRGFADKVKQVYCILTGKPYPRTQGQKQEWLRDWGMSCRQMLQKIGTDCIRHNLHQDAWVMALLREYDLAKSVWIITDVRFDNEVRALEGLNAYLFEVDRPGNPWLSAAGQHESEWSLSVDLPKIMNDGTRDELVFRVVEAFSPILGPPAVDNGFDVV